MLVLLNQDVVFNDYVEDGKKNEILEVNDELGKQIILRGYGKKVNLKKINS